MQNQPIRIGFIGLNPDNKWAAFAHLPALRSLGNAFVVTGVANSSQQSAERTAQALNIPHAFATPQALVESDQVDLVVVTVKVPYHFELVKAALLAGKHVHCEWPLANGVEEAQQLTDLARKQGGTATVGTQMRASVEVRYLAKLIRDGFVGEVLSSTLIADGANWGAQTNAELAYLEDANTGATMLTIPFGHTLAGLQDVLGPVTEISGRLVTRRKQILVADTGESIPRTAADQIIAHGLLESGALFSMHYRGGMSRGSNFLWEICGTEGDVQIKGNIGHGQFAELQIFGANGAQTKLQLLKPDEADYAGLPEHIIARNVAGIYQQVAADISTGSQTAPTFADALVLTKLLANIGFG